MIFVGDIALPFPNAIKCKGFPKDLETKSWFGNLEGSLVNGTNDLKNQRIIYNDKEAINSLLSHFNFAGLALANNHIFDIGSFDTTCNFLRNKKVSFCGIGKNIEEAREPVILEEKGEQIIIPNFGWEVIQCEVTKSRYPGVNPLEKNNVLTSVKKLIKEHPNAKIIPFMHWSYELEAEPQPFERELAKHLIDLGVAGVIGCHPHRIGGFELYKNKPIVYSLGNWMFKQNHYFEGKHKFPDFCNQELALEWDFKTNEITFHFFEYNREKSDLHYTHSEGVSGKTMLQFTPFKGLTKDEYIRWYKKNHYHRNKGLPVYKWNDSLTVTKAKNGINRLRDALIQVVISLKK